MSAKNVEEVQHSVLLTHPAKQEKKELPQCNMSNRFVGSQHDPSSKACNEGHFPHTAIKMRIPRHG